MGPSHHRGRGCRKAPQLNKPFCLQSAAHLLQFRCEHLLLPSYGAKIDRTIEALPSQGGDESPCALILAIAAANLLGVKGFVRTACTLEVGAWRDRCIALSLLDK